jgi:hypothetical protein
MCQETVIAGVRYVGFGCEKVIYGGMAQTDAIALLAEHGIKARKGCPCQYTNLYGLWVEAGKRKERKAEKLLFHI